MKLLGRLAILGLIVVAAGWYLTRPQPLSPDVFNGITADSENGAIIFAAAGCASCHNADDQPPELLSGGRRFASPFGTFIAPNISSDPTHGVGNWPDVALASAIMAGVGRDGEHLFPAFPYTSYNKADVQDVADLIAYLRTLPASDQPSQPHEVGFPFNLRVTLGPWKALFEGDDWALQDAATPEIARGRYLVEALGHCTECHTSRNALGGVDRSRWLAGAENPSGDGRIPNITPAALTWSASEISEYLKSGFTPEFDTAGGEMAAVVRNTSKLTDGDRDAIAAYLKAIPAIANETP